MSGSTPGVILTSIIKSASMEAGTDEWLMVVITTRIMVRLLLELGLVGLYGGFLWISKWKKAVFKRTVLDYKT